MFKKDQRNSVDVKKRLYEYIPNGTRYKEIEDLSTEEKDSLRERATELKIALISFCVSIIIVISKLIIINRGRIYKLWTDLYHGKYDSATKVSELLLYSNGVLSEILHESRWLLLPLLAGVGMTIVTWYTVFVDSCVPGVKPPTPFSPNKSRIRSSPRFHMAYMIAVINGILVFLLTFYNWS